MREHLRPDVIVETFSEKKIALKFPHKVLSWTNPKASWQNRIQRLLGYGSDELYEEELEQLPLLFYFLEELKQSSLLSYSVFHKESLWATLTPHHTGKFQCKQKTLDPNQPLQLSRFSHLRSSQKAPFIMTSPLLSATFEIKDLNVLSLLYALAEPKSLNALIEEFPHFDQRTIADFFSLLFQADLLSDADQHPSLMYWEFHDLLFHTASRQRSEQLFGATFRFCPNLPPLRAIPAVKNGQVIPLFKPDLNALIQSDPSLTEVMENRKSVRHHSATPITAIQLGEFLYRAARIKNIEQGEKYEFTKRPYPGGGACYELEIYPLVHLCEGLESNLYRYLPDIHSLEVCPADLEKRAHLLKFAAMATGKSELPQIVLLIAARFQRVSWKYESIAYSVILKNAGVLIQTMYLAATAMRLAPCAVGTGNSDVFSQMRGADYYEETTVAEFILGSKSE